MVIQHKVEGYENFLKFMKDYKSKTPTFVHYTGSKLPNGKSWCPDCTEAEPFIDRGISSLPRVYNYIVVEVGDREFWKDPKCPFRTNSETKLKVLPTLHKWGTQKRLEGSQLLNNDLIDMLMTEEDDE